ncbi:MAG: neutral/alkaline non-lysosomal ceramidase N-terminal domain-containing protein [Sandaracinaceae bacterium]|nr:neutral/alkaline non-lysosomal ceramidase N-terminal domain-containing protein [Sandaracinaceae bacterium]
MAVGDDPPRGRPRSIEVLVTIRPAWLLALTLVAPLGAGCDGDTATDGGTDAAPGDAGPVEPASLAHCSFETAPPTGGAGGTVSAGALSAGVAESFIDVPLGTAVGSYTARAESFGNQGFIPRPDNRRTLLANAFAPSVGLETIPRIRALALRAGGETVVIMKVDLSLSYQGFVHDVEAALGPEYSGKVIIAASHSHSSFGNYTGHSGMKVGFGDLRGTVYGAMIDQLTATARAAIDALEPARIGFSLNAGFDPDNRVNRDRRSENNELAGGSFDDAQLFVIRVDTAGGAPMAMLPVFGMHGIIHDADNTIVSTDAPGGLERVLEESFDREVLVMHLQGAGGDVSPAGMGSTDCAGARVCTDFARAETIGHYALAEVRAAWEAAGADMQAEVALEMLTRTIPLGPDWRTFSIRDGALTYAEFDGRRVADGRVYGDDGRLLSPIDEFNAPHGAALCGAGDDLGLRLPRALLPGTDDLFEYSYYNCLKVDQIVNVLSSIVDVPFEPTPLCETTTTTVSALRIGEWMIATLPGEPVTLLRDHVQTLSPMPPERTIVVGYAQDHGGYLLRPEDWLSGGYEPSISFWGPLEGEYVAEQLAAVMRLATTPEREDGNAGGIGHPVVARVTDDIPLDDAPLRGTVPSAAPEYLLAHRFQTLTTVQPPATVRRIENVFFTWIGDDPLRGTPRVVLEREVAPGDFEPVRRRSGRPVQDGDLLLTWTPNPILREAGVPRTHYYTVELQVASPLGMPGLESLPARRGFPLGRYRFRVTHRNYDVASDPFEVVPATLEASVERAGADATITLGVLNAAGYRLLDMSGARSNQLVPLRGATIVATIPGGGEPQTLTADDQGRVTVTAPAGTTVTLTDEYDNTVTVTL